MTNNLTKETASKFLSDVPESNKFWCNNGEALSNLKDLKNALVNMNEETFSHHVNQEKNDFSNWINDVIGDGELANEVRMAKSKSDLAKKSKKEN